MTALPDPVYPEDVKANPEWFGDITDHYYECDEQAERCPKEKHYHPKVNKVLMEMMKGKL